MASTEAGAGPGPWEHAGPTVSRGCVTLVFAVLAWYQAASDIVTSTFGRRMLPVGPRT